MQNREADVHSQLLKQEGHTIRAAYTPALWLFTLTLSPAARTHREAYAPLRAAEPRSSDGRRAGRRGAVLSQARPGTKTAPRIPRWHAACLRSSAGVAAAKQSC
eukprot:jgi/Ulvmu1/4286/UM002_0006.1